MSLAKRPDRSVPPDGRERSRQRQYAKRKLATPSEKEVDLVSMRNRFAALTAAIIMLVIAGPVTGPMSVQYHAAPKHHTASRHAKHKHHVRKEVVRKHSKRKHHPAPAAPAPAPAPASAPAPAAPAPAP